MSLGTGPGVTVVPHCLEPAMSSWSQNWAYVPYNDCSHAVLLHAICESVCFAFPTDLSVREHRHGQVRPAETTTFRMHWNKDNLFVSCCHTCIHRFALRRCLDSYWNFSCNSKSRVFDRLFVDQKAERYCILSTGCIECCSYGERAPL
jgi:hypothetical protein